LPVATTGRTAERRSGVCLCILFNHPFTRNIPLLRRLYAGRFSRIYFLVPFEQAGEPDILTVYRGSFAHGAYVVEHVERLDAEPCSHYLFTHDDVILSPWLNEGNILAAFGIADESAGWIDEIGPVPEDVGAWGYALGSAWRLLHPRNALSGTGVDSLAAMLRYLPPVDEARRAAAAYGVPPSMRLAYRPGSFPPPDATPFRFFDQDGPQAAAFVRQVAEALFRGAPPRGLEIPYPIACSGPSADFYIVPHAGFRRFVHVVATLAAAGLFVEMAVPTALYLACDTVRTRREQGYKHIWGTTTMLPRDALSRLLQNPSIASIHPIKLSQVHDIENFMTDLDVTGVKGLALAAGDYRTAVLADYPAFDGDTYLALNPDLAASNAPPYEHFYRFGLFEQRRWRRDPG
jgi:hypothetical protein